MEENLGIDYQDRFEEWLPDTLGFVCQALFSRIHT